MGWHDTARYGAGGALSGAERTGKDNGAAIYWATLKLYAVRARISLFHVYVQATRLRAHSHILVRARLDPAPADHASVISVIG